MATSNQRIRYDLEAAVSGQQDVAALARQLEGLADTLEGDLKVQAQESAQALRELGAKQGAIDNFVALKTEAGDAADRLREAQIAAQRLAQQLSTSGSPTRAQAGQMEKLRDAVRGAKNELVEKTRALDNGRATLRAYGVSSDGLAASERATRQAIGQAREEVAKLAPAYAAAGNAATAAGFKQTQSAQAVRASLSGIGDTLRSIQTIALTAVGGTFLTGIARDVGAVADQYNNLRARISLVTGDGPALEASFEAVRGIALSTGSALESTADLFTRVYRAGKEVGLAQQDALNLTETINKAIQVSGGSAQASDAAITQLIQGLQSGVLRGQEFNSVMEQAPRLAQALADGLGKTTGQLRNMANEGRLTSDVVLKALQGQAAAVAAEFDKLPPTIGRALTNLSTQWTVYVGEVDKASAASRIAGEAINAVANNLDEIGAIAARAGAVIAAALAVQAAGAVRTYITQVVAAQGATSLLALEMSKIPKTLQIAVAFTGFEVGYQFGDMLRENSALARELGVRFVDFVQTQVNSLQFLKEAAAAVFTDDTIEAALDRYNQRSDEQRVIIAQMLVDAEQAPEKIKGAADKAAASIEKIGEAAKTSAKDVLLSAADITEAYTASALAKTGDAQAAEANLRVQLQLAKQSESMALLMGNEVQARKAKIQQMEIEIQLVQAAANVARTEAEGAIAVANAKLSEMRASKEVNLVKQAELENAIKIAQAKLAEADATGKSTEIMRKQLELFKSGSSSGDGYGRMLDDLTGKQRGYASATRDATQAMREQAAASGGVRGQYSRPGEGSTQQGSGSNYDPGRGSLYTRPGDPKPVNGNGQTQAEFLRAERLAGQGASDESLRFQLLEKLQKGALTEADLENLRAVVSTLKVNEKIFSTLPVGLTSLEGEADDRKWANARVRFEQAIAGLEARANVTGGSSGSIFGRTVTVNLRSGGKSEQVETDDAGAQALMRTLKNAGLSARP